MFILLASSAVDRGFEPRSGQAKDFKIGVYCFAKHNALRRKNKDCLALLAQRLVNKFRFVQSMYNLNTYKNTQYIYIKVSANFGSKQPERP